MNQMQVGNTLKNLLIIENFMEDVNLDYFQYN